MLLLRRQARLVLVDLAGVLAEVLTRHESRTVNSSRAQQRHTLAFHEQAEGCVRDLLVGRIVLSDTHTPHLVLDGFVEAAMGRALAAVGVLHRLHDDTASHDDDRVHHVAHLALFSLSGQHRLACVNALRPLAKGRCRHLAEEARNLDAVVLEPVLDVAAHLRSSLRASLIATVARADHRHLDVLVALVVLPGGYCRRALHRDPEHAQAACNFTGFRVWVHVERVAELEVRKVELELLFGQALIRRHRLGDDFLTHERAKHEASAVSRQRVHASLQQLLHVAALHLLGDDVLHHISKGRKLLVGRGRVERHLAAAKQRIGDLRPGSTHLVARGADE
ncbi:hypothetical protein D3C71_1148020 [compost metagenome]